MLLSQLISGIISAEFCDVVILGLTNDSRAVKKGFLFLAYPGEKSDGRKFISQAIENGAAAILYEEDCGENNITPHLGGEGCLNLQILPIKNLSKIQSEIAARFYNYPSEKMNIIGVTGTNGKTSITHFIAQCLNYCNKKSAIIGTIGSGFLGHLGEATLTTPDPIALQKLFSDLLKNGADNIAMEVSSHALDQGRVASVNFDIAVFTQLSRDHLDYHKTMENYGNTKAKLFDFPKLKYGVLNWDDDWGRKIALKHQNDYPIVVYSLKEMPSEIPAIFAEKIETRESGFTVSVKSFWGAGEFHCPLMGRFNVSNVLAVLGALIASGIPFDEALKALNHITAVKGRMQRIQKTHSPTVIIDYSHTPDALLKALQTLREHCSGKLWCVFGCGGDRDPGKRPQMGEIAEKYADFSIITNDNPRTEDPLLIANAIWAGIQDKSRVKQILDRGQAISFAIDNANQGDIILVAGKGHEEYQIIGTQKFSFSDAEITLQALEKKVTT